MDLSLQLYSARNFQPWTEVFAEIKALGYTAVEGFGALTERAEEISSALRAHGLTMPSAHFGLEALEQDFRAAMDQAQTLGVEMVFCPYLDAKNRPKDRAGWAGIATRLENIAAHVRETGRTFGWHNHDFEFVPLEDGSIPMQILLDEAPSISWEADIAWIARGGANPLDWISRHGSRIVAAHVKDIAPDGEAVDEDGWADVGHGTLDWPALTAALRQAGCKLFIAEHDNPADLTRFARRSIDAFRTF